MRAVLVVLALGIAAVSAVAGAGVTYVLLNSEPGEGEMVAASAESAMLTTCELAIQVRLDTPSSYVRIDAGREIVEQASADDYLRFLRELTRSATTNEQRAEAAQAQATRHSIDVEYDASNVYGAQIRHRTICDQITLGGPPTTSILAMRVGGLTYPLWAAGCAFDAATDRITC